MNSDSKIYVAGHRGFVGGALMRRLKSCGYSNLITRTRESLDLRDQRAVFDFFAAERPEFVFLAAARVGGIHANAALPAEFIAENLAIQSNVIEAAHRSGTRKLLFLGSSCAYPKLAPQPIREDYLLTGALEPTNAAFAVAKIAGIAMCEAFARQYGDHFFSVMPSNLYGPGDNFDPASSHVIPALIRKFHEARVTGLPSVTIWGTGTPLREFLYIDDLADACVFLMEDYKETRLINVGLGFDNSIGEIAAEIARLTDFRGDIVFDKSKPDGTPRKLLDISRLSALGWKARTPLSTGLSQAYRWYLDHTVAGAVDSPPALAADATLGGAARDRRPPSSSPAR